MKSVNHKIGIKVEMKSGFFGGPATAMTWVDGICGENS